VRMEGWRQRRLGSKEDHSTTKGNYKTDLTLTGLLMEGPGFPTTRRRWFGTYRIFTFVLKVITDFCILTG
jgi:hypothetical protein